MEVVEKSMLSYPSSSASWHPCAAAAAATMAPPEAMEVCTVMHFLSENVGGIAFAIDV